MVNFKGEMAKMPESRETSIRNMVLTVWFQTTECSFSSAEGVWPRAAEVGSRWSGLAVSIGFSLGARILTVGILNPGENIGLGSCDGGENRDWIELTPAGESPADLIS